MHDPNFQWVWLSYLFGSAVLTVLVWWQTRRWMPCWFQAIFITFGMAILFTPTMGGSAGDYWVPAVIAALFESIETGEFELAIQLGKNIGVVWLALSGLWFTVCWLNNKN